MKSTEVEIFGRKFRLKGDDPDKIKAYADFLNQHLDSLQSKMEFVDQNKLLSLGAIIVTEKYFNMVDQNKMLIEEIRKLNEVLNSALQL